MAVNVTITGSDGQQTVITQTSQVVANVASQVAQSVATGVSTVASYTYPSSGSTAGSSVPISDSTRLDYSAAIFIEAPAGDTTAAPFQDQFAAAVVSTNVTAAMNVDIFATTANPQAQTVFGSNGGQFAIWAGTTSVTTTSRNQLFLDGASTVDTVVNGSVVEYAKSDIYLDGGPSLVREEDINSTSGAISYSNQTQGDLNITVGSGQATIYGIVSGGNADSRNSMVVNIEGDSPALAPAVDFIQNNASATFNLRGNADLLVNNPYLNQQGADTISVSGTSNALAFNASAGSTTINLASGAVVSVSGASFADTGAATVFGGGATSLYGSGAAVAASASTGSTTLFGSANNINTGSGADSVALISGYGVVQGSGGHTSYYDDGKAGTGGLFDVSNFTTGQDKFYLGQGVNASLSGTVLTLSDGLTVSFNNISRSDIVTNGGTLA